MRANEISFFIVPLDPAYKAGLSGHLPVKIRGQSKKLQTQGVQILRNEAYLQYAAVTKDAVSMSNGSWTFNEAIKDEKEITD
jgi:hypothetical protein